MPVAVEKEGVLYYLAYNQVGSLRVVADSAGNIVKQIEYDAHGYILNDTNPGFDLPFGFAGGLHDRDTGLVRFGYRDYDPDTGRWTAKDPIGFAGGDSDLYGYVLNDPVNLVDPQGLMSSLPKWMLKKALKQIGKKIGKDGPSGGEIAYPEEQQQMDKDTDGDGINNYWDEDDDNDGKPDELDPMPETPTHPIPWDQKDNPCK
ncbi:MAG: RHS repeat-associated core domain-containing protein [Thermodesulfobacteriota bacterium]|nr:RHS repeat-associated core domain-containing protein [Thermodesulfobacteriota bacterium]